MKKTIEINYEEGEGLEKIEFKGSVVMKRLSFSEKNMVEEDSTDIRMYGNVPQIKISTSKLQEHGIVKSVVESNLIRTHYVEDKVTKNAMPIHTPFELNMSNIKSDQFPREIGDTLFAEYTNLNEVSDRKN